MLGLGRLITSLGTCTELCTVILTEITKATPFVANLAVGSDCIVVAGRAGINFWVSPPNPVAKTFFAASCVCGAVGAGCSAAAIATSATGLPGIGLGCDWCGRSLNRIAIYALQLGNVTNITDPQQIAQLMC